MRAYAKLGSCHASVQSCSRPCLGEEPSLTPFDWNIDERRILARQAPELRPRVYVVHSSWIPERSRFKALRIRSCSELVHSLGYISRLRWENRWRRERDSNPRSGEPESGFQDRRLQPLGHPSGARVNSIPSGFRAQGGLAPARTRLQAAIVEPGLKGIHRRLFQVNYKRFASGAVEPARPVERQWESACNDFEAVHVGTQGVRHDHRTVFALEVLEDGADRPTDR